MAETEYHMQVESDIAPYKGLLMGLFFMTVGMEISAGLLVAKWRTILAGILGLILGKVQPPLWWSIILQCIGGTSASPCCWGLHLVSPPPRPWGGGGGVVRCGCLLKPLHPSTGSRQQATDGLLLQTAILAAIAPFYGLSKVQAARAGLLLAAGGEFAFVALCASPPPSVLSNAFEHAVH